MIDPLSPNYLRCSTDCRMSMRVSYMYMYVCVCVCLILCFFQVNNTCTYIHVLKLQYLLYIHFVASNFVPFYLQKLSRCKNCVIIFHAIFLNLLKT